MSSCGALRSLDGGRSWKVEDSLARRVRRNKPEAMTIKWLDERHGLVHLAYEPEKIAFTRNGGEGWRVTRLPGKASGARTRLGDRIWWCGQHASLFFSDDFAASWKTIHVPWFEGCAAIEFTDQNEGWALSQDGVPPHLYKTHDGGQTWIDSGASVDPPFAARSRHPSESDDPEACSEERHALTFHKERITVASLDFDSSHDRPLEGSPMPSRDGVLTTDPCHPWVSIPGLGPATSRFVDGRSLGPVWLIPGSMNLPDSVIGRGTLGPGWRYVWTSNAIYVAVDGGAWVELADSNQPLARVDAVPPALLVAELIDGNLEVFEWGRSEWRRSRSPLLDHYDLFRELHLPVEDPTACLLLAKQGQIALSLSEKVSGVVDLRWDESSATLTLVPQSDRPLQHPQSSVSKLGIQERDSLVREIATGLQEADPPVMRFSLTTEVTARWKCDTGPERRAELSLGGSLLPQEGAEVETETQGGFRTYSTHSYLPRSGRTSRMGQLVRSLLTNPRVTNPDQSPSPPPH